MYVITLKMNMFTWVFITLVTISYVYGWDNEELELFDLVEEINENFYEVLGVAKDASSSEIKKAYRKKTLILHPDKNEAPDAEEKFRKLVAVYEVLKDDDKRERYNYILQHGLPDWRQPVFYYRRVRKMGVAELAVLLCIIITIGHYFVLWAVYLERRLALEDFFSSKKKREKKGKRKAVNDEIEEMLITTLDSIPKPRVLDLWPVTMTMWIVRSVLSIPAYVRRKQEEKRLREEMVRLKKEEEERIAQELLEMELRKQEKKKHKQNKRNVKTADLVEGNPVVYGLTDPETTDGVEDEEERLKQTVKEGEWTDDDYVMLSKAYVRFPGGTTNRWEKIAEMVGRSVGEVTSKCKQMKGNFTMNLSSSVQGGNPKSTKKNVEISDSIISRPETEIIGGVENSLTSDTDSKVRKRTKHKPLKDTDRTLMISREPTEAKKQTGLTDLSQTGSDLYSKVHTGSSDKSKIIQPGSSDSSKNRTESVVQSSDRVETSTDAKVKVSSKVKETAVKNVQSDAISATSVEKDSQDTDIWSQNQQVILEWALRQYPKGTEQRWEKIAEHIPGKSKDDCIARFKHLAEIVKQRKQQQTT